MKGPIQLLLLVPLAALVAACAPVTEGVVGGAAEATTEAVFDAFDVFDQDRDEVITESEFEDNVGLFDEDVDFDDIDADRDGIITEEEFDRFRG